MPRTRNSTWLPLDVRYPRHRKVVSLPRDVRYRHLEALCHCREHDTDGHLTPAEVDDLMRDIPPQSRKRNVNALVDAGLWDITKNGWVMHDWDEWNGALDQRRAKDADRKRRSRTGE